MDNDDGSSVDIHLLELPYEILEKIFSYISYEEIGKVRKTCKRFKEVGSQILNSSFQRLQSTMLQRFHSIKSQMPRRESARRTHPLVRECDIVETVHMRLTLLQMSFGKHIERKHCCFFSGEILDEVYRIFRYIKTAQTLARAYKVTDELFDLTTMAMEYFKDRIEPGLPEITYFATDFLDYNTFSSTGSKSCSWKSTCPTESSASTSSARPAEKHHEMLATNAVLNRRVKYLRQGVKRNNSRITLLRRKVAQCYTKYNDQQKQLIDQGSRLEEYEKKFEENSRKFSSLFQELNKCKTELQYWRSKSPANQPCCTCKLVPDCSSIDDDPKLIVLGHAAATATSSESAVTAIVDDDDAASYSHPALDGATASTSTCDFVPIPVGESSSLVASCYCSSSSSSSSSSTSFDPTTDAAAATKLDENVPAISVQCARKRKSDDTETPPSSDTPPACKMKRLIKC